MTAEDKRSKFSNSNETVSPDNVVGEILLDIGEIAIGTLFEKVKFPHTSNYAIQAIESLATASFFPNLTICPSIDQIGDGGIALLNNANWKKNLEAFLDLRRINGGSFQHFPGGGTAKTPDERKRQSLTNWYNNELMQHKKGEMPIDRVRVLDGMRFFENNNRGQDYLNKLEAKWVQRYDDLSNLIVQLKEQTEEDEGGEHEELDDNDEDSEIEWASEWPLEEFWVYKHSDDYGPDSREYKLSKWYNDQVVQLGRHKQHNTRSQFSTALCRKCTSRGQRIFES